MTIEGAHRPAPTAAELLAEYSAFQGAVHSRPISARPRYDLDTAREALAARIVERIAARDRWRGLGTSCDAAQAALALAEEAVATFDDLEDDVGKHYADLIANGQPPELSQELRDKRADQHHAQTHLTAVRSAEARLERQAAEAHQALEAAEDHVAAAALDIIRCQGEALAERCQELRREFVAVRRDLMNAGATRLRGLTMSCSALWLNECRDPIPEAKPDADMASWNARARELTRDLSIIDTKGI
jgi:chromosome segregation ATPase